jgi:carboxylesterase type B
MYIVLVSLFVFATHCAEPRRLLFNNYDLNPFRRQSAVVETSNGKIQGTREGRSDTFFGIPFAKPPVGKLRFRLPESLIDVHWEGVRQARKTGPMCVQRLAFFASSPVVGEEGCLYLNVYRPSDIPSGERIPVMVFIPGGAFSMGSSYWLDGQFDGSTLAREQNVIVVVPNYRLGLLGFFASEQIQEVNGGTVGNLGLQDQREALRWVKREISAFGGDPDNILLFGESAGGFSVIWHAVSPRSSEEQLFHSVIAQSATADLSWFFQSKEDAFQLYAAFAAYIGCPFDVPGQLECLQAHPPAFFLDAWLKWSDVFFNDEESKREKHPHHPKSVSLLHLLCSFGPVVDGHADGLIDMPATLVKRGQFHRVPLVAGITRGEGSIFTLVLPHFASKTLSDTLTVDQWIEIGDLIVQRPEAIKEFYKLYPIKRIGGLYAATVWANEIVRDLCFGCSTEELVRSWGEFAPSWMYLFSGTMGYLGKMLGVGSMHSFDLTYVFKTFPAGFSYVANEREVRVANEMGARWASMARHGHPNPDPSCLPWPEFKDGEKILEFGFENKIENENANTGIVSGLWNMAARAYTDWRSSPDIPPSRLFDRATADKESWPEEKKCDFWYRQRPLPWIIHMEEHEVNIPRSISSEEISKIPCSRFPTREDAVNWFQKTAEKLGINTDAVVSAFLAACFP